MPPNDRFDRFDRFSKLVPRFDHLKWKMAAAGILVGLISGFLVVLYRLGIEYGTDTARWIYARIRETPWLVAPWAVVAWMVKKEPMAGGSGIPQTNGVVICGLKMRWQTILPVRFIGGLLGSLFGLSLGREGPSIQIGASGAQFLSHRLRGKKRVRRVQRTAVRHDVRFGRGASQFFARDSDGRHRRVPDRRFRIEILFRPASGA